MTVSCVLKKFPVSGKNLEGLILKTIAHVLVILVSAAIIIGCKDKPPEKPEQAAAPAPVKEPVQTPAPEPSDQPEMEVSEDDSAVLKGDDTVLVRVGGVPVTQYDFDRTVTKLIGNRNLPDEAMMKILESMAASLAIAQAREAAMSEKDLAVLEKKVRAYREELLVRQYLEEHTALGTVTPEMILEYYNSNPGGFGEKTVRQYEMITIGLDSQEHDIVAALLKTSEVKENWKKWAASLRDRGYQAAFQSGQDDEKTLNTKLSTLMKPLGKGETSQPVFIRSKCCVIRITDIKENLPQSLESVQAQIRRSLAPVQLRKAVKEASDRIMGQTEIIYENSPARP